MRKIGISTVFNIVYNMKFCPISFNLVFLCIIYKHNEHILLVTS